MWLDTGLARRLGGLVLDKMREVSLLNSNYPFS
jgi:hypothetical protein